jgi:hypothetical protein
MKKLINYSLLMCLFSLLVFACSKKEMDDLSATASKDAKPTGKISTPTISCYSAYTTETSIGIQVTAGATGLPAGFSLQWMTLADYTANNYQWYNSDDPRLCKASFSGNANDSRYNLGAGQSIYIKVGEILLDNGASSNCTDALLCETDYVFRAFGHAINARQRSDFTANRTCTTLDCDTHGGCTYAQGYWRTHGPEGCATGNNLNEWGVSSLMLGSVTYTDLELCSILNATVSGNGLIGLAHQLIAAKLNVANNATSIQAIADADALIGSLVIPPVGGGYLSPGATNNLVNILATYNEGGAEGENYCE